MGVDNTTYFAYIILLQEDYLPISYAYGTKAVLIWKQIRDVPSDGQLVVFCLVVILFNLLHVLSHFIIDGIQVVSCHHLLMDGVWVLIIITDGDISCHFY